MLRFEAKTYLKNCEKVLPTAPEIKKEESRKVEDIDLKKFKHVHDKR